MIVTLIVPDDLYLWYGTKNPQNPRREMEKALKQYQSISKLDESYAKEREDDR